MTFSREELQKSVQNNPFMNRDFVIREAQEKARRDRVAQMEYAENKGRVEGRIEGQVEELLKFLQMYALQSFEVKISEPYMEKLSRLDIETLEKIALGMLKFSSMEQLEQAINQYSEKKDS